MTAVEYLEGLMLLCFSTGWYWSIGKMLVTKVAIGKSLHFVMIICTGYLLGVMSKLVGWNETGVLSSLVYFYGWNFLVTAFDACLVVHFTPRQQDRPLAREVPRSPA